MADKVAWSPQLGPQSFAFYDCMEVDEVMYGGARGGGKTSYLLGDFGAQTGEYKSYAQGLICRKSYPQLDEIIKQGNEMFVQSGNARFNKSDMNFNFNNGAVLRLRHLDRLEDCENYQGHEYSWIGFDELTNFKDFRIFERMRACARTSKEGVKPVIRYTGNPGGRLHNEVKDYFINPEPLGRKIITNKAGKTRIFVPSKVTDNLILMKNDPDYIKYLESITDELLRKAWLEGSWDVALGSFFGDIFSREKHVIPAFTQGKIPKHWNRYHAFDWGSAKPFACLWYTVARDDVEIDGRYYPNGSLILYREYYGNKKGEIDTGLKLPAPEVARRIRAIEMENGEMNMRPGPGDNAMWNVISGPSIASEMSKEGVRFIKCDKSRETGWEQVRIRLKGHDQPLIYFTENCVNTIRTLPVLSRDEKKWDDIETTQEDHLLDVVRYICMTYPMKPVSKTNAYRDQHSREEDEEVLDPIYG